MSIASKTERQVITDEVQEMVISNHIDDCVNSVAVIIDHAHVFSSNTEIGQYFVYYIPRPENLVQELLSCSPIFDI